MPPPIRTVYSNAVDIQTTETELILTFGADFSDKTGQDIEQFAPEVRIVIPRSGAPHLVRYIQQALESDNKKGSSNQASGPATARRKAK